jgi:hypothetical protein
MRRNVLAFLAAASPLAAQAADLGTIFPADEAVCYAQDFDAAYLEQHPTQKVTSMRIVRPLDPTLRRSEEEEKEGANASGNNTTAVAFAKIGVRVRKTGSKWWSGYFSCVQFRDGRTHCSSGECDGGAMAIDAPGNGGATVYFDPDASNQTHFVVVGCDDSPPEHGAIFFSIETDSAPFLLERVPMADCAGVDLTR